MDVGLWIATLSSAVASVFDIRHRIIPNTLVYGALAAGSLLLVFWAVSPLDHLTGFVIASSVSLVAYWFGGLGGGDVKLLASTGLLVGYDYVWGILFLCYGLVSAIFAIMALRAVVMRFFGSQITFPKSLAFAPAVFAACAAYSFGFRLHWG